jgi:putative hemolysin
MESRRDGWGKYYGENRCTHAYDKMTYPSSLANSFIQMNAPITEILILILLIFTNGFFSLAEMAIVSARKVRLQQRAEDGSKGAETALVLARQPTRFLSTVQTGITLIGILSGAFGGATIAEWLAAYFARYPALQPYSEPLGVGIVVTMVTYFSLVIGELVPKRLALNNAESIASSVAPLMNFISKVATPLVSLLSFSTEILVRVLRIKPTSEPAITEEEVKILIEQGRQTGIFEDVEQEIVERVFRLSDRTVNSLIKRLCGWTFHCHSDIIAHASFRAGRNQSSGSGGTPAA